MVDLWHSPMCNFNELLCSGRYKLATRQIIQAHMYSYLIHFWLTEYLKIYKLAVKKFIKIRHATNIYIFVPFNKSNIFLFLENISNV